MQSILDKEIKFLKGVGPKRAEVLESELGISTYEDLLFHFPYRHIDRSRFYKINEIHREMAHIQLKGQILKIEESGSPRQKRLHAVFSDGTGTIELVWFKGVKWIRSSLKKNTDYVVFGKPSPFKGHFSIAHPEMESLEQFKKKPGTSFMPQYHTTEKMKRHYLNSRAIQKLLATLITEALNHIPESLPAYILSEYKLMPLREALKHIHFPEDSKLLGSATHRLKFEELFYIQLDILRLRKQRIESPSIHVCSKVGDYLNAFYTHNLPFELTAAQKRVIREIRADLGSGKQMNRLLQGDVGSGKTMVALMSMLIAIDNGFQTCLIAPTEILAQQHYRSVSDFLGNLDIDIRLLTGSTKKSERKELHDALSSGNNHILIGTHALLEDMVKFNKLGLVVIDEQHRFGVAQRARLWKKNSHPPHVLVMTATPIPRTLAMTLYGDLKVSRIDELPPGRKPVVTKHATDKKRAGVFEFIRKQIGEGRQIFIVYPLISESEKMDYKALEEGAEILSQTFKAPEYHISMVHGRMKPDEKDHAMQEFKKGHTHILVATTVIEVGVDVPNASVMIIESAERFGLSQLHQLRGRVGRGASQSFCLLMTKNKLSDDSRKRIQVMCRTNDGFEIAEADLRFRGPGDIAGTQQSGLPIDLKIASLVKDGQLLEYVRQIAENVLDTDPVLNNPENIILNKQLKRLKNQFVNWRMIS